VVLEPPSPFLSDDQLRADVVQADKLLNNAPANLLAAWAALAAAPAEPNSFMEPWFVIPALKYLRDDASVRLIAVWRGTTLIGVVLVTTSSQYGRIPIAHTINWQSIQCFYGAPLIQKGDEAQFWLAVLDVLDAADWAPHFFRMMALEENGAAHMGLVAAAQSLGRPCPIVHRLSRAMLKSDLSPDAYLDQAIRGKKRKEFRRLSNRLAEVGVVTYRRLTAGDDLDAWIDAFLHLEAAGWKGNDGAAFANTDQSALFFKAALTGANAARTLEILRLDLDDRPIAMLVNFIRPPGSFSFKIAYDEALARFSPGVMIEIENLKRILTDSQVEWMDSCAHENHPMINSLWMERRALVQVSVPLRGMKRRFVYSLCRLVETLSATYRNRKKLWSHA
jgi:CelD/BcsL family acetyltransferase involved in cellulose biosynthesis